MKDPITYAPVEALTHFRDKSVEELARLESRRTATLSNLDSLNQRIAMAADDLEHLEEARRTVMERHQA